MMSVAPVTELTQLGDSLMGNAGLTHDLSRDTVISDEAAVDSETIRSYGDQLSALSEGPSLLRYDTISEIQRGLTAIGNIIQIVTSVLSLFGASNVDRWVI